MKQIEFRECRTTTEESLETTVLVGSLNEIEHIVNRMFIPLERRVKLIKLEFAENEYVDGWQSYAVHIKLHGDSTFSIIGYTNGNFED